MRRKLQIVIIITSSLVWLILSQAVSLGTGNVYYVRSGATGNNDGSDWTNAFTELPQTLERGAIYYIAGGTYSGSHLFNDPEDGEKYITIKKAVDVGDHGPALDWDSSYGDGSAVFLTADKDEEWQFYTGYYIIDGQVGGGPGNWDGSTTDFGIKILGPTDGDADGYLGLVKLGSSDATYAPSYLTFTHMEISTGDYRNNDPTVNQGTVGFYHQVSDAHRNDNINVGPKNVTISYCYFHDETWLMTFVSVENWTIEYNYFRRTRDGDKTDGVLRTTAMQAKGADDITIRYNVFEDCGGTATIKWAGDVGSNDLGIRNWDIYGNIFYFPPVFYTFHTPEGVLAYKAKSGIDAEVSGIHVYNNTFINLHGSPKGSRNGIRIPTNPEDNDVVTDNVVSNNIFYYINSTLSSVDKMFTGINTVSHNWFYNNFWAGGNKDEYLATSIDTNGQVGTGDPFVNWQGMNFNLTAETEPGTIFSWMDNKDMFGNTRGADGVWDRGAYEYVPEQDHEKPQPEDLPDKISLECYNNVFNPTKGERALIWVELPKQAHVKISLYDTRGNKIRKLADEERDAETCKYYWNGKDDSGSVVGSGLYFVHIQAGDYKKTKKIVVVK